jgi:hypothetical protein
MRAPSMEDVRLPHDTHDERALASKDLLLGPRQRPSSIERELGRIVPLPDDFDLRTSIEATSIRVDLLLGGDAALGRFSFTAASRDRCGGVPFSKDCWFNAGLEGSRRATRRTAQHAVPASACRPAHSVPRIRTAFHTRALRRRRVSARSTSKATTRFSEAGPPASPLEPGAYMLVTGNRLSRRFRARGDGLPDAATTAISVEHELRISRR